MSVVSRVFELTNETGEVSTQTAVDESSHYSLFFRSIQFFSRVQQKLYIYSEWNSFPLASTCETTFSIVVVRHQFFG